MKRWLCVLIVLIGMAQGTSASNDSGVLIKESPITTPRHIVMDLPRLFQCNKKINAASNKIIIGPYCSQDDDPLAYNFSGPVYQVSSRTPSSVTLMKPSFSGKYILTKTTDEWIFVDDDKKIYRQSLNGGQQALVTTPFRGRMTQTDQQTPIPNPCLTSTTTAPAVANQPNDIPAIYDLQLNSSETFLTYQSLDAYGEDSCGYPYPLYSLHSVNLATNQDIIISDTYFYMYAYRKSPTWIQTPSGYTLFYNNRSGKTTLSDPNGSLISEITPRIIVDLDYTIPLDTNDDLIVISPATTQTTTLNRLNPVTNTITAITTLTSTNPLLVKITNDEQWALVRLGNSTYTRVNLLTGAQDLVTMPAQYDLPILHFNGVEFYYRSMGNLQRYNFDLQETTTIITDTDSSFAYYYTVNNKGTGALIAAVDKVQVMGLCVQRYEYFSFETSTSEVLYVGNPINCIELMNAEVYNPLLGAIFSPDDRFIVFIEYVLTDGYYYRYHMLILEDPPLWYSYTSLLQK